MKRSKSGHRRLSITVFASVLLLIAVFQFTANPTMGLLSESFESGTFGVWTPDFNFQAAYFQVSISTIYAYDGFYSVKLWCHGLPSPKMTVWIERTVPVPPSTTMNIGINFWVYNENASAPPQEILAYFDVNDPEDYADFSLVSMSHTFIGWREYNYQTTVTTGPTGQLYAALGHYNQVVGGRDFYFDLINLTGVSDDFIPPTITNQQPANQSIISIDRPQISADYSDASGIDTSSVILRINTNDVTFQANVGPDNISYTPSTPLTEGVYDVYLEVKDASENRNKGTATWSFNIDMTPPIVTNLMPANHSVVSDNRPFISVNYADPSEINTSSVEMRVDSQVVPVVAQQTDAYYQISTAVSEGQHNVSIRVSDNAIPGNIAFVTWWFIVDSQPPSITNLRPADQSITNNNRPVMGADYYDASGVETGFVFLEVDGVNVTSLASVGPSEVTFTPLSILNEGIHSVYLEVCDASPVHRKTTKSWVFRVDTLGPTITNLQPTNGSMISNDRPMIATSYSDPSGIDTSTVILTIDSVDITSQVSINPNGVTYTPMIPLVDGSHDIQLEVRDASPGRILSVATWYFTTDKTPPVTDLSVLTPSYFDSINFRTFINSSTSINLTATDDGSGVQSIWYLFYAQGETVPPERLYTEEFKIPATKLDGKITIKFKSVDALGNEEPQNTIELYLDNTPPENTIPDYDPIETTYTNNPLAMVVIQADDLIGSGIQSIRYGIDDQNCANSYSGAFVIGTMNEGEHRIYHVSIDNIGNIGEVNYITIFLDTTPPTAEAGDDVRINFGDLLTFDGSDSSDGISGSGIINYTWTFTYLGYPRTLYGVQPSYTFEESGEYVVTLRVEDRAGNNATDTMTVRFHTSSIDDGAISEFPWWIILLIILTVAILTMFLLAGKRKKGREDVEEPVKEETSTLSKCPSCGRELRPDDEFCSKCGIKITQEIE